jgi:two-component sensor histidine kinase
MLQTIAMTSHLSDLRARILERAALGKPAEGTLNELARGVEALVPGVTVGVTVLDRSARTFECAYFPSLSDSYAQGIHGAVVEALPGSCALAVVKGAPVVCDDVAADTRFHEGWRALGLAHGLKALHSYPASADGSPPLGTLVIAADKPLRLSAAEEEVVRTAVELAGVVLVRRRADMQAELLVGELQHRIRNLTSAIGAVVYSTLKSYPNPQEFRRVLDGRLAALARAHTLAFDASETELKTLLASVMAPYGVGHRVRLEGPTLQLAPDAAVAFSLAAHELATNAVKYGALSADGGDIDIRWLVHPNVSGERQFELTWQEKDGRLVEPPRRTGFGAMRETG